MDPNIDASAQPIGVALVKQNLFSKFLDAAKYGYVMDNRLRISSVSYLEGQVAIQGSTPDIFLATAQSYQTMAPGQKAFAAGAVYGVIAAAGGVAVLSLTPLGPFVWAAAIATAFGAPSLTDPRVCTLVILNGLNGTLSRDDEMFDCGSETHYPAIVDPSGKSGATNPHEIAGQTKVDFGSGPETLYGLSFYRFENKRVLGIGFYGTGGAIAFKSSDPRTKGKVMAISWLVPESGDRGCCVTSDLSKWASLSDFYYKTADTRKETNSDPGDYYTLHCAFWDRQVNCDNDLVLTVSVENGSK
jgi:hypothetical protein